MVPLSRMALQHTEPPHCYRGRPQYLGGGGANRIPRLSHLRLLLEAKGGTGLLQKPDNALEQTYMKDIKKLASWKKAMEESALEAQVELRCSYVFLAIDQRPKQLPQKQREHLTNMAATIGVDFNYIYAKR